MRVVVVGGGITGLSAGYRLLRNAPARGRSIELLVLEADTEAGGHVRSLKDDGFVVEAGPNAFIDRPSEPHVRHLVQELGLESHLVEARPEARRRFVAVRGRLHRIPDSPPALLRTGALSPLGKLRLLCEPWARRAPKNAEETVYEFARRRVGAEAADVLVDSMVSGISAGESRELSVEAAFPAVVEMERVHGSLFRALAARRVLPRPRLMSFSGGMATLVEAMARRLGPALRTAAPVVELAQGPREWRVRLRDGATLAADAVLLAVSARCASSIVRELDPELTETLSTFPDADIAVAALGYRDEDLAGVPDGYGYLVARSEARATMGVVWETSVFEGRAPRGCTLFRAMLGGTRHPQLMTSSPHELVNVARRDLEALLGISGAPVRTWTWRWPGAITQYTRGHLIRVRQARARAAAHAGLDLCGTSYDGITFAAAVASGGRAADRLLAREPRNDRGHGYY